MICRCSETAQDRQKPLLLSGGFFCPPVVAGIAIIEPPQHDPAGMWPSSVQILTEFRLADPEPARRLFTAHAVVQSGRNSLSDHIIISILH